MVAAIFNEKHRGAVPVTIKFHPHAIQRLDERGILPVEATAAVEQGEELPAKFGRTTFRRNFDFQSEWRGKYYLTKQVEVIAAREDGDWMIITAIARYF